MLNLTSGDPPPQIHSSPPPDAISPTATYEFVLRQPPPAHAQLASCPAVSPSFPSDSNALALDLSTRKDEAGPLANAKPFAAACAPGGASVGGVAAGHRSATGGLRRRWKRLVRRITCMHVDGGSSSTSATNNAPLPKQVGCCSDRSSSPYTEAGR